MSALEGDEKLQKMGIIAISYGVGSRSMDAGNIERLRNIRVKGDALPVRFSGAHYCYDNPQLRPIALLMQHAIGRENRLRFRPHFGKFRQGSNGSSVSPSVLLI